MTSADPFARGFIRLLTCYMTEKVTKAHALICTSVQTNNNDKLACSQPVRMKKLSQSYYLVAPSSIAVLHELLFSQLTKCLLDKRTTTTNLP